MFVGRVTMGNTPSVNLLQGAGAGDLDRVMTAMQQGADINFTDPTGKGRTALHHACKAGHINVVHWLLNAGALPLIDEEGNSALMLAVKYGHASIAAILLDKGVDVHYTSNSKNATDVAGLANKPSCVRLIEARCCVFAAQVSLHIPGFFSDSWAERWVVVFRARPWDNPAVDRRRVLMYVYENRERAQAEKVMMRPAVVHVADKGGGHMEFEMVCEACIAGAPSPVRLRADRTLFDWLSKVLTDGLWMGPTASGTTNLFPPSYLEYTRQYETARFSGAAALAPPPPVFMRPMEAPQQAFPAGASSGGGRFAPSAPPAAGGGQVPMRSPPPAYPPQQQPMGFPAPQVPYGSAPSAPPSSARQEFVRVKPAYLHEGLLKMLQELEEGTLLPEGSPAPPETYVCSITMVRLPKLFISCLCVRDIAPSAKLITLLPPPPPTPPSPPCVPLRTPRSSCWTP